MTLSTIILLVLALYLIQLILQEMSRFGFDLKEILGNRDTLPKMSIVAARLDRAKNNMLEALPFFLGLSMLILVSDNDPNSAVAGATTFLIARIFYIPAYLSGAMLLRSIIWLVGILGLIMMALTLF